MDELTGEKLFEMYRECLEDEGVGMDDWESLEATDQAAWNALARKVQLRG